MADLKISDVTPTTPQATTRIPAVNGTTPTTVEIGAIAALSLPIGGGTLTGGLNVASGNVGIGTTSPAGRLTAYSSANVSPSLTSGAFAPFIVDNSGVEIAMGAAAAGSPYEAWIQARAADAAWDLALNPLGGNVGIGTTSPTSKLHVAGLVEYADNATAVAAGLTNGAFYRTGDLLKVVHA